MSPPVATGLIGSLRELGDNLLGTVQDRLELLSVEVQEEKLRLIQTFIWINVAVFSGMMFLVFLSLTVVYLFWDEARLAVLIALTSFYALAFLAVVRAFRRHVAREPRPLDATLREVAADRSCIPRDS
jgi:uncharacterized membrane protein YqjE